MITKKYINNIQMYKKSTNKKKTYRINQDHRENNHRHGLI